jgi:hypothetical protein
MSEKLRTAARIGGCTIPTALALLCGGEWAVAGDYVVEISGAQGMPFAGTCLVVKGDEHKSYDAVGTVPLTLRVSGDTIACAIVRKAAAGQLTMTIKSADGRLVAESSQVQPFGVVMAAGQ